MSELKARYIYDTYTEYYNTGKHELAQIYIKTEADKVIAEKDAEIVRLKADYSAKVEELCIEKTNVDTLEQAWKQSQRALWIARAKRAIEKIAWFKLWNTSISTMNPEDGARQEYDKWKKVLGKFLAKTEDNK